ncbi:unnamed protein product, partial [Medioppia subpectinata]
MRNIVFNIMLSKNTVQYSLNSGGHHWMEASIRSSPRVLLPKAYSRVEMETRLTHTVDNSANNCQSASSNESIDSNGKRDTSGTHEANDCYIIGCFSKPNARSAPPKHKGFCVVCGDRATGLYYKALTCDGCKGIFRRGLNVSDDYSCKYGGRCEIDVYNRRKCIECRYNKCLNVGMSKESVGTQCQCKPMSAKQPPKGKRKPNTTTKADARKPSQLAFNTSNTEPNVIKPLTGAQKEAIDKLVDIQNMFQSPTADDMKQIPAIVLGDKESQYKHLIELTALTIKLIVRFAKKVPEFVGLLEKDKVILLKACSGEVIFLRASRKYDVTTNSIIFATGKPWTEEDHRNASPNHKEYALITAIALFSRRPKLLEPKKVEAIKEFYTQTLEAYVYSHTSDRNPRFGQLLTVLADLRSLAHINFESCNRLVAVNNKLPPLLAEMWDIECKLESLSIDNNSQNDFGLNPF